MFWTLMAIAPLGALLPGPIGEAFRAFRLIIGACVMVVLIIVGWTCYTSYQGAACVVTSSPYHCQQAYDFAHLPLNLGRGFGSLLTPDPKKVAEYAARDANKPSYEQTVTDRYNARMAQQRH